MTITEHIGKRLLRLASSKAGRHGLLWVGLILLFSIIEILITRQGFFYTVSNNTLRLLILGLAVYYNIYVLIPKYLANKKFQYYFGFLLMLVLIITPIEAWFIYLKSADVPQMRAAIVENLNYGFLTNFFVLGVSSVAKISLDWFKNLRERQELETQNMQSELRFLKSQINPHFLFNTLNSLYALTLKKSDLAPDIVLKLSEMMRYMLYECNERYVPVSKELNYISNYLELERLRQGKTVDIRFEVQGSASDQKIAPLMFIPFIENCFKHGAGHHLDKGFVHILLKVDGNRIDLRIQNSKPEAMPKPVQARSGGIGLVNVRRRLDLLYPKRYQLNTEDSPTTYSVHLKLQLD